MRELQCMEAKLSSMDPAHQPVTMRDLLLWDYQYRAGGAEALSCVGCICRSGIIITHLPIHSGKLCITPHLLVTMGCLG